MFSHLSNISIVKHTVILRATKKKLPIKIWHIVEHKMNSDFRDVKMWKLVCLWINETWLRLVFCFMTPSWEFIFQTHNAIQLFIFFPLQCCLFFLVSITLFVSVFVLLFLFSLILLHRLCFLFFSVLGKNMYINYSSGYITVFIRIHWLVLF